MFEKYTGGSKSLNVSILEGFFSSVMLTAGVSFLVPFALFLGATDLEIGLLSAFPALFGALVQLFSARLLTIFKSRKKMVAFFVALQALSWAPIAVLPFIPVTDKVFWLIAFYTIGVVFGGAPGPVWQGWMKNIIPPKMLGTFFGFRTAIVGGFAFGVILIFGFFLNFFSFSSAAIAFGLIFGSAVISRLVCSFLYTKIRDPIFSLKEEEKTTFVAFLAGMRKTNFGYFVLYGSLMTFTIAIIGPFFAVYLINTLAIDYFSFTIIVASSTLASILSVPYWGRLLDRYGTRKVLKATSRLVCLSPLTLIFLREVPFLVVSEFFSGVVFSGFYLALANFVYDSSAQDKIIKFASYQAVLFGVATFLGVILGGYIISFSFNFSIISNSFYLICLIAIGLRILTHKGFIYKIREVKRVEPIRSRRIVFAALTLAPVRSTTVDQFTPFIAEGIRDLEEDIKKAEKVGRKEFGLIVKGGEAVLKVVERGDEKEKASPKEKRNKFF